MLARLPPRTLAPARAAAAARVGDAAARTSTVTVPVSNGAGYPFGDDNYGITVTNVTGTSRWQGKIEEIYYGFTPRTKSEYLANNDVPWLDGSGKPGAAGWVKVTHSHDGGYKGSYQMDPVKIEVPEGMNLVFKIKFHKWSGTHYSSFDPPKYHGVAHTMTYFVEGSKR